MKVCDYICIRYLDSNKSAICVEFHIAIFSPCGLYCLCEQSAAHISFCLRSANLWKNWSIKVVKEKYGVRLKFPEGWGEGANQKPYEGGMDIFQNHTIPVMKPWSNGKVDCCWYISHEAVSLLCMLSSKQLVALALCNMKDVFKTY